MVAPLVRIALGVAIFIDVLRVFLPSLITIFGSAGSTPAELMGAYALSWFVAAYLAVLATRLVPVRWVAVAGAVLLVGGRGVLQFTDGDSPQLYVASVAVLGGLCWLVATAIAPTRALFPGLVFGFALATGLHAALDTVDLVWRDGAVPIGLAAAQLVAFLVALWWPSAEDAPAEQVPAPRALLAVGPAVLLWGLYTGNPAHAQASDGWSPIVAAVVVAAAGFLATPFVAAPRRLTRHPAVPAVVLIASAAAFAFGTATIDGVVGVAAWWTVPAQVAGAVALAATLGWTAAARSGTDRPYRRGLLLVTGFLLFILFTFAYYAAYDLGLPNDYVPLAVAAVLALLSFLGTGSPAPVRLRPWLAGAVAAAVVAALAAAAVPWWRPVAATPASVAEGLRVASYNIRMGFGLAGTMTVAEQTRTLRALDAHVIALSEVDRAWFLNGGHDDLRLIAEGLGMRMIWAPAADEVWGDALLTNLPVTAVRNHPLVQGGPTGAQALEVRLRWNDRDVTVIATHLQPPKNWQPLDQVEQLADIVRDARKPVVVAGDLNLEPGEPAWDALMAAGLQDAFAQVRPFVTSPSPNKVEQIDHILASPGFRFVDAANPDVPWSDHRPVAVTLLPE